MAKNGIDARGRNDDCLPEIWVNPRHLHFFFLPLSLHSSKEGFFPRYFSTKLFLPETFSSCIKSCVPRRGVHICMEFDPNHNFSVSSIQWAPLNVITYVFLTNAYCDQNCLEQPCGNTIIIAMHVGFVEWFRLLLSIFPLM